MTTLGLPWRVMICGSVWARSITSDSRALAPATVQRPEPCAGDFWDAVTTCSYDYND